MKRFAIVTASLILFALAAAGLLQMMRSNEPALPPVRIVPRGPSPLEYQAVDSTDMAPHGSAPEVARADTTVIPVSPEAPEAGASHREVPPPVPPPVPSSEAHFSVEVKDVVTPYEVTGLFVMPEETINLETTFTLPGRAYELKGEAGDTEELEPGKWQWTAPDEPGAYALELIGPYRAMNFNVFVKTPFDNSRPTLDGYEIGSYESRPLRGDPRFKPPRGLIEVNETTESMLVSPHFTLGVFTCHQPGDPKFVALDEKLLLKLEMLLEKVKEHGIKAETFTVMSGYRTPQYNKSIGNTTRYSLHLFGRAADIFIDTDGDGQMDDLNRDGRIDIDDARVLFKLIDDMRSQSWYQPFLGGLGLYGPNASHGPFVHVDSRGYVARW